LEAFDTMPHMHWTRDNFTVTCDPDKIDRIMVREFLAASYWAQNIPQTTVDKSIDGSLCFSLLQGGQQIGFARVITDRATIAYLGDVFVLPEFQGRGLGKWLIECVTTHPQLQGLRRWVLLTKDAHDLYSRYGFTPVARPDRYMELHDPDVYGGR
jgi:GNAT superfamily N-acetyltransferase